MKKLAEFAREETGEEWLREGYKVVSMRRNIMFRMLLESTRLLLFGNAGGAALIIGFMSTTAGQNEAHGAESALKRFADGDGDRSQVMFNVEGETWRLADWSTFTGIVSAATFIVGGLAGITLLVLFF